MNQARRRLMNLRWRKLNGFEGAKVKRYEKEDIKAAFDRGIGKSKSIILGYEVDDDGHVTVYCKSVKEQYADSIDISIDLDYNFQRISAAMFPPGSPFGAWSPPSYDPAILTPIIDIDPDPNKTWKAKGGVTCKKCNDFNKYLEEPNESDGTHVCYKCKKGY